MDGTEEGMALAEMARKAAQAAAEKKRALDQQGQSTKAQPPPAKAAKTTPRVVPPCMHEVAIPRGFDIETTSLDREIHGTLEHPHYKGPRAKTYPFTLDPFQETAVSCLERKESVLVAAHTSAGKTAVAEYAIAMSFRDSQRVVYTSPLKALSNQKFRELTEEFTDVGLMTGDVTVNPNANCVVMTTEILRSMIYRGSELLREVAWVVFDEVHYMQDRERGVVWEETIIFMPKGVRMVFLSATLANASDFAGWVARLHSQPCHVVYTDYRPTPLQHYAYAQGASGLHLIVDDKGRFRHENFQKVRATFEIEAPAGPNSTGTEDGASEDTAAAAERTNSNASAGSSGRGGGRGGDRGGRTGGRWGRHGGRGGRGGGRGGQDDEKESTGKQVETLLGVITRLTWQPVIFFAFARKECELLAGNLMPKQKRDGHGLHKEGFNFNTPDEAEAVEQVYNAAVQCLSPEDQQLRQVVSMKEMIKRGIGVHHSGLLPIMKEVIEILFSDGYIKVLFATETFAMGLNMPAKTVVFTKLRKWDGEENRFLTSGEYIQMSGRAGRRGKDDKGIVILMVNDDLSEEAAVAMCMGKPSPLVSSFKLSYYTMLNMVKRLEGGEQAMEEVIRKSFQQFTCERQMPLLEAELERIEEAQAKLAASTEVEYQEYKDLREQLEVERQRFHTIVMSPPHVLMFLTPGRIVEVTIVDSNARPPRKMCWGWAVVASVTRKPNATATVVKTEVKTDPVKSEPTNGHTENGTDSAHSTTIDASACYIVDLMLTLDSGAVGAGKGPQPAQPGAPGSEMQVVSCGLGVVSKISALRLSLPPSLVAADSRRAVMLQLQDLINRFPNGLPLIDPVEDMSIEDKSMFSDTIDSLQTLEKRLAENPVYQAEKAEGKLAAYMDRAKLQDRADDIRAQLRSSQLEKFRTEVKHRTAVLKRLGHLDQEGVITDKGRAACEIDAGDELLTTELMFHNAFMTLTHAQLVALVSCLVPVEKSGEHIKLMSTMSESLALLQSSARHIAEVSIACKLDVDPDAYIETFQPFLMDVMAAWSKGASFREVCDMTDLYEGSIIRAARRLDELLQQMTSAAKSIGATELADHIEAANLTIRRDIIFAASLYV